MLADPSRRRRLSPSHRHEADPRTSENSPALFVSTNARSTGNDEQCQRCWNFSNLNVSCKSGPSISAALRAAPKPKSKSPSLPHVHFGFPSHAPLRVRVQGFAVHIILLASSQAGFILAATPAAVPPYARTDRQGDVLGGVMHKGLPLAPVLGHGPPTCTCNVQDACLVPPEHLPFVGPVLQRCSALGKLGPKLRGDSCYTQCRSRSSSPYCLHVLRHSCFTSYCCCRPPKWDWLHAVVKCSSSFLRRCFASDCGSSRAEEVSLRNILQVAEGQQVLLGWNLLPEMIISSAPVRCEWVVCGPEAFQTKQFVGSVSSMVNPARWINSSAHCHISVKCSLTLASMMLSYLHNLQDAKSHPRYCLNQRHTSAAKVGLCPCPLDTCDTTHTSMYTYTYTHIRTCTHNRPVGRLRSTPSGMSKLFLPTSSSSCPPSIVWAATCVAPGGSAGPCRFTVTEPPGSMRLLAQRTVRVPSPIPLGKRPETPD